MNAPPILPLYKARSLKEKGPIPRAGTGRLSLSSKTALCFLSTALLLLFSLSVYMGSAVVDGQEDAVSLALSLPLSLPLRSGTATNDERERDGEHAHRHTASNASYNYLSHYARPTNADINTKGNQNNNNNVSILNAGVNIISTDANRDNTNANNNGNSVNGGDNNSNSYSDSSNASVSRSFAANRLRGFSSSVHSLLSTNSSLPSFSSLSALPASFANESRRSLRGESSLSFFRFGKILALEQQ